VIDLEEPMWLAAVQESHRGPLPDTFQGPSRRRAVRRRPTSIGVSAVLKKRMQYPMIPVARSADLL
jgi:hypothetical protein